MTSRRQFLIASVAAVALVCPSAVSALEESDFTAEAFETAQQAGKPILIHVVATWCETCHAQKEVIERLEGEEAFRTYSIYTVDFDEQKDVMRTFNAPERATLIAFKGTEEVGRIVGDTREDSIRALMQKAI